MKKNAMTPARPMPETVSDITLQTPAFLAKCLGDENRLRILFCLGRGEKSVSAVVEELQLSQPLVSHHLKELKRSLLVTVERGGPFVYYSLADDRILSIIEDLHEIGEELLKSRISF